MATTKYRLPVPLTEELKQVFEAISQKNQMSLAQTIIMFAQHGLEYAEDDYLGELVDKLDTKAIKFTEHNQFWTEAA